MAAKDNTENEFKRIANNARETRQTDERAMEDRDKTENRELSDEERVARLRNEFVYSALPAVPEVPGWHFVYLSTNNQYDTLQRRIRMGYQPVKYEDLDGHFSELVSYKVNSGQFEGMVMVNEMLLCKIPTSLYNAYMKELHHTQPNVEHERLQSNIEKLTNGSLDDGKKLAREVGNGTNELLKRPAAVAASEW